MATELSERRRFKGKTCLVTGGGRGIGRAVAEALAAEGADVGVMARTGAQCAEVVDAIGRQAIALEADVTDADACQQAVDELTERFGELNAVVHAAAISPVWRPAEFIDADVFTRILQTNVTGAHAVASAAAPSMLENGGAIVNVASVLGLKGSPQLSAYGASKAALVHLTRTLAREWAYRGVRVNAVCPAYVETAMTESLLRNDKIRDEILTQTPLGRFATLREIVEPVLFLLSDDASYITGAFLTIDGGMAA